MQVETESLGREAQNNLGASTGMKVTQMTWCSLTYSWDDSLLGSLLR